MVNTDRLNTGTPLRAALINDGRLAPGAVEIRNNIVMPGAPNRKYVGGTVGFQAVAQSVSHNLWTGGGGPALGSRNAEGNARFAGPADFHLVQGSAAIDAGTPEVAALVANDYDIGTIRPQGRGFDIGAYEFTPP